MRYISSCTAGNDTSPYKQEKFSRDPSFFLDQFLYTRLQGMTQVENFIEEKEKMSTLMRLSEPGKGGSMS